MINRLNIWIVLFLMMSVTVFGETNFGLKGGAGIRELVSLKDGFMSPKIGGGGGLFVRSRFGDVFGVQLELMYALKGAKSSSTVQGDLDITGKWDTTRTKTITIHNIEVPLLFKFYAPGYQEAAPNLFIGPYYSYMIDRNAALGRSISQGSRIESLPDADATLGKDVSHDWGIVFGLGIDFGLGTFDLRSSIGMNPIEESGEEENYHNLTVNVMMGFLISY